MSRTLCYVLLFCMGFALAGCSSAEQGTPPREITAEEAARLEKQDEAARAAEGAAGAHSDITAPEN
jgi:hypothetical protein